MPSPFPGMDPYLEGPLWMTVHPQLGAEIARQLAPKLRPRYLALTTERFVLGTLDGVAIASLYPDVAVSTMPLAPRTGAGARAAVAPAPLEVATVVPTLIPHVSVEIRDVQGRELVTAIELLSPTNKTGEGRQEYLAKRRRILISTAHLVEIDLLREGERVPMQEALPFAPYFVFVGRAERRPITEVWSIRLEDRLPVVPIPLLPGDSDVQLDLQTALNTVYDVVGYDLAVDYSEPPPVRLTPEETGWVHAHVRSRQS